METTRINLRSLRHFGLGVLALSLAAFTPLAQAKVDKAETPFAIGAEIGTAGYGPVAVVTAGEQFTFSLGYTFFDYVRDFNNSKAAYKGDLKLSNLQLMANWHPFAGKFHITAGAFQANNKVTVVGRPNEDAQFWIGGNQYSGADIGDVHGDIELSKGVKPYLGLGWSKVPTNGGYGLFINAGVLFTGAPKTTLTTTVDTSALPEVQADLKKEQDKLNKDMKPYSYFPIIQFGVLYRF